MNTDVIRRRKWKIAAAAVLGLVGVAAASQTDFSNPSHMVQSGADTERLVSVVLPEAAPAATDLLLPAQLLPYEQTTLYARTDGFIAKWNVDRGARVKTGDLLATIDAPELDQQANRAANAVEQGRALLVQLKADQDQALADVESSRAQVKVAEANREFAAAEFIRLETAGAASAVSRSEVESAARNRDATNAQLAAARAEVNTKQKLVVSRAAAIATQESSIRGLEFEAQRLRELQGFKRITAPFDGTIRRRYAEVGMLISTITPQPLFHIQNSATLRVQVDVPQGYAAAAKKARTGDVIIPEQPNRPLPATVARTANAIDSVTRTLRVELELPNADRSVLAGTYVQVRLALAPSKESKLVPIAALRYTPQGIEVVAVNGGITRALPVKVGRDYGRAIEVIAGLKGDEILVVNPPDGLADGQAVRWNSETKTQDGTSAALARAWPAARTNRN